MIYGGEEVKENIDFANFKNKNIYLISYLLWKYREESMGVKEAFVSYQPELNWAL